MSEMVVGGFGWGIGVRGGRRGHFITLTFLAHQVGNAVIYVGEVLDWRCFGWY